MSPRGGTMSAESLGLKRGTVVLLEHDACWLELGAQTVDAVRAACDGLIGDVRHVGSTSVPGLAAKPIVDVAVGLLDATEVSALRARLEPLGYLYRGDSGDDGGHLFVLESAPQVRTVHLHGVAFEGEQWRNYLRFRERMLDDATLRARYAELKGELARLYPEDRRAYTAAKNAFIQRVLSG